MPTGTTAPVTAVSPTRPVMVTGPAAPRTQSVGTAVPPPVLVTCFTSVSVGAIAVLVIVQVTSAPSAMVTVSLVSGAPGQDHADAVYPVGPPDSDKTYEPAWTGVEV